MPSLTTFTQIRLCGTEWMSIGAAAVPVLEDVGSAVSQLPIAHSGFCNINHEGYASSKNADKSCSDPSLARVEARQQSISQASARMNGSQAEGIFDLRSSSAMIFVRIRHLTLPDHGASQLWYSHYKAVFRRWEWTIELAPPCSSWKRVLSGRPLLAV